MNPATAAYEAAIAHLGDPERLSLVTGTRNSGPLSPLQKLQLILDVLDDFDLTVAFVRDVLTITFVGIAVWLHDLFVMHGWELL
ncbi:hypothetical protein SDRG_02568 [Saprolegnia diclina VS20]|uniref:Uncharacterized protein n=1 Tax=Saprolegnia diclina (strain VS20) TaxID=1156394 RepID=T0SAQ7_SAPDV|nr:hypothetical protein SDRG_02568 [Saprolegnia diclina VS20]EQC39912.1 hypothetical protein SDRG_02568 [Saprolegnia diclina VS20]|eukprot:XP_008606386.1 hypothetical protein SDRG_02568 [Saprolegnia diclina VS20]